MGFVKGHAGIPISGTRRSYVDPDVPFIGCGTSVPNPRGRRRELPRVLKTEQKRASFEMAQHRPAGAP